MASRTQTTGVQGYVIHPDKSAAIHSAYAAQRQQAHELVAAAATSGKVAALVTKLREDGVKVHRPIAGWRGLPRPHLTGNRYDVDIESSNGARSHFTLVGQPDGNVECQHLVRDGFRGWSPKEGTDQPHLDPERAVDWMMTQIRELGAERAGHSVA